MVFTSLPFLLFLPVVFALYWLAGARRRTLQNALLLAASYVFYGWWNWRLLGLVVLSTGACYAAALGIEAAKTARAKRWLGGSCVLLNLGLLGYFKYANFFTASLADALRSAGFEVSWPVLNVVLPIGISFYTFQTLSYVLDVWQGKMRATRDALAFAVFVAFFPQLVAGPIERGARFLPQFLRERKFDAALATDGCRQMLWGFFKKVAVADACAPVVAHIFDHWQTAPPGELALGAALFGFQIYGDFSGYSDIAVGCSRLFGLDLTRNFATPYFARDIAEFWRRWHISLTAWFRDYVYIPLGGSRCGKWRALANTVLVFLVSGLWHGANWTFVAWGALHGLLFAPLLLLNRNRKHTDGVVASGRHLPRMGELFSMLLTFSLVTVGWIFFRSATVGGAWGYLTRMLTWREYLAPVQGGTMLPLQNDFGSKMLPLQCWLWIGVMLVLEWVARSEPHGLRVGRWPGWARWAAYGVLGMACLGMFKQASAFIYFQF